MDPNEALRIIRAQVGMILDENDGNSPEALAEAVRGLDEWLSIGGFLPDAWMETPPRLKDNYGHEIRPI